MFKLLTCAALVSLLAACAGMPSGNTAAMGAAPASMEAGTMNMTGGKAGGPN